MPYHVWPGWAGLAGAEPCLRGLSVCRPDGWPAWAASGLPGLPGPNQPGWAAWACCVHVCSDRRRIESRLHDVLAHVLTDVHTYIPTDSPTYLHTYLHTYWAQPAWLGCLGCLDPIQGRWTWGGTLVHQWIWYAFAYVLLQEIDLAAIIPTCLHSCLHTYMHTYMHTYIPTYT